jgi:hypothetical protein
MDLGDGLRPLWGRITSGIDQSNLQGCVFKNPLKTLRIGKAPGQQQRMHQERKDQSHHQGVAAQHLLQPDQ